MDCYEVLLKDLRFPKDKFLIDSLIPSQCVKFSFRYFDMFKVLNGETTTAQLAIVSTIVLYSLSTEDESTIFGVKCSFDFSFDFYNHFLFTGEIFPENYLFAFLVSTR